MEGPAGRPTTPHAASLSLRDSQFWGLPFVLSFLSCIKEGSLCLLPCARSALGCWQVTSWSSGGKAWNSSFPSTLPFQFLMLSTQSLLQLSFPLAPTRSGPQRGGDGVLPDMLNLRASLPCPAVVCRVRHYLSSLHRPPPDTLAIKMSKQISLWKSNSPADLPFPAAPPGMSSPFHTHKCT